MNEIGSSKPSVERKLLKAGQLPARIVQIVDLGLQAQNPYQGQEKKPAFELYVTFEFPTQRIEVDGESRPMWKSRRVVMSTHEKSRCKQWYDKLDPENKYAGDWASLLTSPCLVFIAHEKGKGKHEGKVFDKIGDINPLVEGMEVAPLENEPALFDLTSPNMEVWERLPEFLQNIIKENLQYDGSKLQNTLEGNPTKVTARATGDQDWDVDSDRVDPNEVLNITAEDMEDDPF